MKELLGTITLICVVALLVMAVVAIPMWGIPQWGVYRASQAGEAELKQAQQNRQIAILEAEAERDSAELKRETDVIRAEGIAEANRIIGASITSEYIQWRWVEGLHNGEGEIIYIPTEANLPILEALRGAE